MANWTKILPFCFVSWYARRNCEKFWIQGSHYVNPYKGVLIKLED